MMILFLLLAFSAPARAADCAAGKEGLRSALSERYGIEQVRGVLVRVIAALTPAERKELAELSERFNSIPMDDDAHMQDHFAMQARAKVIVRAATSRAKYRVLNPASGDAYDAVVGRTETEPGIDESVVEIRELLIEPGSLPQAAIWVKRGDAARNPEGIVSLNIAADPKDDAASWSVPTGPRAKGSFEAFLDYRLQSCR